MLQSNIIEGDVLDVAEKVGIVDLVFCSPPYEDARSYGIKVSLKDQAWVDWAVPRFEACLAHCRGLVAWVIEGRTRNYKYSCTPMLFIADLHRRYINLRKPPIFHRIGIPGSSGPDWLRNDYEFIVCATNGGRLPWSDNSIMGEPPAYGPDGSRSEAYLKNAGPDGRVRVTAVRGYFDGDVSTQIVSYLPPERVNPGNVLRHNVGGGKMGSRFSSRNEAPFPETLADFFVRSFCPPGGTVWDCFSGSGTTVTAALKAGRRAIASDIRSSQCQMTAQRRAEVAQEMELEAAKRIKENK